MAKIAIATRQPVGTERHVPGIHRVQGINSHLEDIRLRGQRFTAVVGDAVVEATLIRRIVGASELTLTVLDPPPARRLLRSKLLQESHELILDGLHWKLVKVSSEGQDAPLTLTYEPLIVYLLKRIMGPNKALRDLMTRAEFAQARAFEARPRPHFIAPELHVVQDIASPEAGKAAKRKAEESRGKGIGQNPDLKINGRPATKAQVEILERMLRVGESKGANSKVMESMVVTCIDESIVGAISSNLMQQEPFTNPNDDDTNPEDAANGYLDGWNGGVGAIEYNRAHPDAPVAEICTNVQANREGATPYERFLDEGRAWVAAYGGGSDVATLSTQRYAFQQSKTESNWKVLNRSAGEVHWRCFESASWIYFLDEPTLLRSHRRMQVSDSAPGIIDTTFDYDVGKEVTEVTVEALAKTWAAPPGSVASVSRHGPADGLYLVEEIETKPSGRKGIAQITLKKPTEPLPEPQPKTTRGSTSFGSSAQGAPAKVMAIIDFIDQVDAAGPPYVWGGGHGSFASPSTGQDCSGFVSAAVHAGGYLSTPITSGEFAHVFDSGEGDWVTIYGDSQHVLMKVKYPDGNWRWAETSSSNPSGGAGWVDDATGEAAARDHGNPCHPPGL
jgi:hypothetical protein